MTRILIAEDDPMISSFIDKGLRARGYSTQVAGDGNQALTFGLSGDFDLMILDIGLPDRSGYQVLADMRAQNQRVPVIVLTGRPELRSAVQCLDEGADDYMTKPFRFDELVARVQARLRPKGTGEVTVLAAGGVHLDLLTKRARVGERNVDLTRREFSLLEVFVRHPEQVLSRAQLLSHVWGYAYEPGNNVINVYVAALRRKLGEHVIESVRGMGYRFRAR